MYLSIISMFLLALTVFGFFGKKIKIESYMNYLIILFNIALNILDWVLHSPPMPKGYYLLNSSIDLITSNFLSDNNIHSISLFLDSSIIEMYNSLTIFFSNIKNFLYTIPNANVNTALYSPNSYLFNNQIKNIIQVITYYVPNNITTLNQNNLYNYLNLGVYVSNNYVYIYYAISIFGHILINNCHLALGFFILIINNLSRNGRILFITFFMYLINVVNSTVINAHPWITYVLSFGGTPSYMLLGSIYEYCEKNFVVNRVVFINTYITRFRNGVVYFFYN